MKKLNYWLFLFAAFLSSSCHEDEFVPGTPYKGTVPVDDISVIAKMTNDFGWDLFQEIAAESPDKNVLISPLSVQTALSMAANGANGSTIEEILNVLGCEGCIIEGLNKQNSELRVLMEEQSGSPRLISANGFFYDSDELEIRDTFLQALTNSYRAEIAGYDFDNPVTLDLINQWVKENTADKIDKIIDNISPNEVAFIINALHFKAEWSNGFHPLGIYQDTFLSATQQTVVVDYLNQDWYYLFAGNENFEMVDLQFKDSTYTFSLIQPTGNLATQADWVSTLDSKTLSEMWQVLTPERIDLSLPKFEVDFETELANPLKKMGITSAFIPGIADFSNLGTAPNDMYISQAKHKAILKIDENGAEGGAVTALGIVYTSAPPVIKFDSPFVIVLRHKETNTILFAGLINDPSL